MVLVGSGFQGVDESLSSLGAIEVSGKAAYEEESVPDSTAELWHVFLGVSVGR